MVVIIFKKNARKVKKWETVVTLSQLLSLIQQNTGNKLEPIVEIRAFSRKACF